MIVGPIIAVLSFVCSIGNVPLASILWSGGISFGGVVSFIYADLIVVPLIIIYGKYYGRRAATYITLVLFASMVVAGLTVDVLFSALHLVPTGPRPASAITHARFAWNYTTWLPLRSPRFWPLCIFGDGMLRPIRSICTTTTMLLPTRTRTTADINWGGWN